MTPNGIKMIKMNLFKAHKNDAMYIISNLSDNVNE